MTRFRLLLLFIIVLIQQPLFSQDTNFNNSIALNLNSTSPTGLPDFCPGNEFKLNFYYPVLEGASDTLKNRVPMNMVVRPQWLKAAIVPAALIMAGTITLLPPSTGFLSKYSIHDKVLEQFPNAGSPIDNYLQFVPLAAVYGLKAAGVKSRSDLINQLALTAKAELLMTVIVTGMKSWTHVARPDGSNQKSMPSGHTAQAFVSATILDMEYRDSSPWISISGYAAATATGVYRMINNKHWISDVLVGAGIGIFSTKAVYFTHRYHWGKKGNMVILPAIYTRGGGVSFAMLL